MVRLFLISAVSFVVAVGVGAAANSDEVETNVDSAETLNWVRVADAAGWQPRDSQGELVFDNKLWIFGGWFNSYEALIMTIIVYVFASAAVFGRTFPAVLTLPDTHVHTRSHVECHRRAVLAVLY